MSHSYLAENVYEYKDTGILLLHHKRPLYDAQWILVIPFGEAQMYAFTTIQYMKYKDNKICMLTSTHDTYKYYEIVIDAPSLNILTLDLYAWLREKVCPSPEPPSAT